VAIEIAGEMGMHADGMADAIAYHRAHETPWRRDFPGPSGRHIGVADEPADNGPSRVPPRGGPNGPVLRRGVIVAEWGDTERADMSFSVAKRVVESVRS
jgi:hypothetical protein